MSDNIQDDILEKVLESQPKFSSMGNLQHSINRSLELARNSKPFYQKGETKSTNHLVYEMNEFYMEMAQKISEMNVKRHDAFIDEDDDEDVEDTDSLLYDVVNAIRKKRNDPEMKKQIETVLKLDQLMEDTYKTLKVEKMERKCIQKELCSLIEDEDDDSSKSRFFKNLCDLEDSKFKNSSKINQLVQEQEYSHQIDNEYKNDAINGAIKKDSKFIKRNIQLAKNTPTMYNPSYSLTDEEKVKLESLLSDIDKIDDNDEQSVFSMENQYKTSDLLELSASSSTNYPFSFSEDSQARIQELDTELKSLSQILQQDNNEKENTAERYADEGKLWLNEDRLKQLDEKLEKLQNEREAFVYTPNETVTLPQSQSDDNDTINDVESISYDTIRERSQFKNMEDDLSYDISDEELSEPSDEDEA